MRSFLKNKKRPRESGVCYVLGSGESDFSIPAGSDIFGVNYSSDKRCKYIGSLHSRMVRGFKELSPGAISFSCYGGKGVDWVVRTKPLNISSGMYCAYVACLLGYEEVHLVGIRLEGEYEWYRTLVKEMPFRDKIRSYDGWTKEWFGGVDS